MVAMAGVDIPVLIEKRAECRTMEVDARLKVENATTSEMRETWMAIAEEWRVLVENIEELLALCAP